MVASATFSGCRPSATSANGACASPKICSSLRMPQSLRSPDVSGTSPRRLSAERSNGRRGDRPACGERAGRPRSLKVRHDPTNAFRPIAQVEPGPAEGRPSDRRVPTFTGWLVDRQPLSVRAVRSRRGRGASADSTKPPRSLHAEAKGTRYEPERTGPERVYERSGLEASRYQERPRGPASSSRRARGRRRSEAQRSPAATTPVGGMSYDRVEAPLARDSLQLVQAPVLELDPRSRNQILHRL